MAHLPYTCLRKSGKKILTPASVCPPLKIIVETKKTLTLFKNQLTSPPIGYIPQYTEAILDGLTPPHIFPNSSAFHKIIQWWCLSWPFYLTRPFPGTYPQSKAPLLIPVFSTSPCRKLHQSNYTNGSSTALFSRCSIKIFWRMGMIYFTSRRSPPKRRGSASTQVKPSQTKSPNNTLRRSLPTSRRTPWCQWHPCHWPIPIHLQ